MNKILSYIAKQTIRIATACLNIATTCLGICLSEFTMKHIALSNDTSLKIIVNSFAEFELAKIIVNSFAEFELAMIYTISLLFIIENFKKQKKIN